jgi:large subunit ribosomal protein L13
MTTMFVRKEDAERNWWIVDATNQRVGRIATHIAKLLRGKHKPTFTPNVDNGDFVVVINTDKMEFTGSKWLDKKYYRHSRFFGSLKEKTAEQMRGEDSTFIISEAVRGMLPDNRLSMSLINKLKAYPGAEHPHSVQKPQAYTIEH